MLCRSPDVLANSSLLEGEPRTGTVAVLRGQEGSPGIQGSNSMFEGSLMVPDSAWTAGFVSKSNSYKAWIGSEEAKQTKEASSQRSIEFQLSPTPGRWPDDSRKRLQGRGLSSGRNRTVKEKVGAALVRRTPASAGTDSLLDQVVGFAALRRLPRSLSPSERRPGQPCFCVLRDSALASNPYKTSPVPHSARRATIGSTREARRAGINDASAATPSSATNTAT